MLRTNMLIFLNTNYFPSFPHCGQHKKPRGIRGLTNHYNILFYPKLGHAVCIILQILCACI